MKIRYPILNISIFEWSNDIVEEIFREDEFYHSSDDDFFNSYLLVDRSQYNLTQLEINCIFVPKNIWHIRNVAN